MTKFKDNIRNNSKKSRIILANDYDASYPKLYSQTIENITLLHDYLCAIKLNFHLLLPLGETEIKKITQKAHEKNLLVIADIKLNDIGNTNLVTSETLWNFGFDAVIVNPIMGPDSLKNLVKSAHEREKGVITLCHMSAPEARLSYEMSVTYDSESSGRLYQLFLEWALKFEVDGIISGATFPEIIKYCKQTAKNNLDIYSPGIGTQGGDPKKVLSAGTDFLIVGRTILNSDNPLQTIKELHESIE